MFPEVVAVWGTGHPLEKEHWGMGGRAVVLRGGRASVVRVIVVVALLAALVAVVPVRVGRVAAAAPPGEGASPAEGGGVDIAMAYLEAHLDELGLTANDIADLLVTDHYTTVANGVTHVYLRQRLGGVEVVGANLNVNIGDDGTVLSVGNRGVARIADLAGDGTPGLSEVAAVRRAAARLGLPIRGPVTLVKPRPARGVPAIVSDAGISHRPIPVQLVWQPLDDGSLRLAWSVRIDQLDGRHWWDIRVDADTGAELARDDFVDDDSVAPAVDAVATGAPARSVAPSALVPSVLVPGGYRVYPAPVESPSFGSRSLVIGPEDATASQFGWHDTDGVDGAEHTITRGNNVYAYTDVDGDNVPDPGSAPDGGPTLTFDFPLDLTQAPSAYRPAAVTNLFFWNNLVHDTLYHYGFDEVAGNFQANTYGKGGVGNDAVNAEAQNAGNCNANFATPPDGVSPRMQMFTCNLSTPSRDSDLDNGVIVHEYGHGVSNRLTGGPSNVACLGNAEQAGEGWSDYLALMFTMEPGDSGTDARGIGAYLFGQPPNGPGIRAFPYSTDMGIDPRTYDSIKTAAVPHGVGSVFAAMLWEVTWALIDDHGFHPDLVAGSGGNNIALQLVIDGMKLQPCNPGFVDARDAILLADRVNNGGANECLIWEAFAKRGLGYSAIQGSPNNVGDGVQAFDIPLECQPVLKLFKSASPAVVFAGDELTFTLEVVNDTPGTLTDVTVTDPVPAQTTYVAGSADCGGGESGGVVTFPLGTMAAGATRTCSFRVLVDAGLGTVVAFGDDMESGAAPWTATAGTGTSNWVLGTVNAHSPTHAWFAANVATTTDQYLTMASPVVVSGAPVLRFWHHYRTESTWDGGVVEISTDGGATWSDLGPAMTSNAYNGTLRASTNPIAGRQAFTGDSGRYLLTEVDLGAYVGRPLRVRFRLGTDSIIGDVGWYIDDVEIVDEDAVNNTACVDSVESDHFCDSTSTRVLDPNVNYPPVAEDDAYTMDEDTTLNVAAPGVLDNDTDADGDALVAVSDTGPSEGSLTLNSDGSFSYSPDADFCGGDSFTYVANDGTDDSDVATVSISVACVNDAPTANDDAYTTDEDTVLVEPGGLGDGVLANDTDVENDPLNAVLVTGPSDGSLTLNADGSFSYSPDADFCGGDSFTYVANDGTDDSDVATVSIDVACVNDAPEVAVDSASITVSEGATAQNTGTDRDVDGDVVMLSASIGTIVGDGSGSWSWTYTTDGTTPDQTVTILATDGNGGSASTTFELVVANLPPSGTVDVSSQTVQYSDAIAPVTVTATDAAGDDPLTATTSWSSAGSPFAAGLPTGLVLTSTGCDTTGGVECQWTLTGVAGIAAGDYVIRVSVADPQGAAVDLDIALAVTLEDARIAFATSNPVAVQVASDGGTSGVFSIGFELRELDDPDDVAGDPNRAGDITLAIPSLTLVPVGPGSPVSPTICSSTTSTGSPDPDGGSYDVVTVTCQFAGVPVNTYEVIIGIGGGYHHGQAEDVVVVFDPSLGFTTGGGTYTDVNGDRVNFGYTMKYNKKRTNVQGSLLVIRHTPEGGVYRLKSNSVTGLAIGSQPTHGWASFTGKATYREPGWVDAIGNYDFVAYVEDRGTPGGGADKFWISARRDGQVAAGLSMPDPATTNAALLTGGNIVVPH